jgi:hypothetical protein
MTFDAEKFAMLAELVRQARSEDRRTFAEMQRTKEVWSEANKILTERQSVMDKWVAQQVAEAITLPESGKPA